MTTTGLILPAGSPLVQFRVDRTHNGDNLEIELPSVIWVDRSRSCICRHSECGRISYRVPRDIANHGIQEGGGDFAYTRDPIVCSCQGVFIE